MFIAVKVFVKSNFSSLYKLIHKIFNPMYEKIYRKRKLQSFQQAVYKQVSFAGQKYGIWLDPQNAFIDEEIFVNGVYEPEILLLHKKYLKKGDTYLDIGANIGDTSLFTASIVGKTGKVFCYEPIKHLAEQIQKSALANNFTQIYVIQKAIALESGESTIYKNSNNIGASSMLDLKIQGQEERIHTSTGSEIADIHKINVIKIDVEGYEWVVVQALRSRIEKDRPIIFFEYTPGLYGTQKTDIIEYLQGVGYKTYDIENNLLEIINSSEWYKTFRKEQTNILCLPS